VSLSFETNLTMHERLMPVLRSDVTDYETLKSSFDEIVKDFGRIDGMWVALSPINNT
jgi:NAD(P)-dependent dehydrogenase (short-subunit alcohol dehydrogenase family)